MWTIFFRRILDTLLFSNVFIACCAVAQGGLTYLLLSLPIHGEVLAILGCATLALYNFSMIVARPAQPQASPYRRVRWIFRHEKSLWVWTGVALLITLVLGFRLHVPSFLLLGLMGGMGLAYNLPFIRHADGTRSGLRQLPGFKVFYIAFIWVMSCIALPVAEAYHDGVYIHWPQVGKLMGWMFLFMVAITIPFDIRDIYQDRHYGLKTIPVFLGERWAYRLCIGILIVHALWIAFSGCSPSIRMALVSVDLCALLFIGFPSRKKREYHYFLVLDGLLVLQFVAVYLCIG